MARLRRLCPAGLPQHVIQRGNNRSVCFADTKDFIAYAHWLEEYAAKFAVAVHAWVFMTNHVHLLMTPGQDDSIPQLMQSLGRRYVQYFNYTYERSGTLWEGRYKSCPVQTEQYLLTCYRYIEMNPVRAGMVCDPAAYQWSSYRFNGLGHNTKLGKPHEEYLKLGSTVEERTVAYRALFKAQIDGHMLEEVRDSISKGLALGNERFKDDIEQLYGRRVRPAPMGRPRAKSSSESKRESCT